ncbi:MAG: NUDIX domain-containing protein [Nannocystaceae bacterium]|nr:NUDIX domain-containing protein [Nannocystaceae bacterium]
MANASPRLLVAAGLVWLSRRRVLLQRRSEAAAHGAGCLEFPGGKVERGEAPIGALARELVEEWGPRAAELVLGPVAEILHHVYPPPGPEVVLMVFHVDGAAWSGHEGAVAELEPGASVCAYDVEALPVAAFLEADQSFAARLARGEFCWPAAR